MLIRNPDWSIREHRAAKAEFWLDQADRRLTRASNDRSQLPQSPRSLYLAVVRGDVVREGVEGSGRGLPSERAVGPVVIVEVDEPGVAGRAFSF